MTARSTVAFAFFCTILHLAGSMASSLSTPAAAAERAPERKTPERRASGLERRIPWTGSRIQGSPDPGSPYRTENAFPKLRFSEPLAIAPVPSSTRLAIAERGGKLWTFVAERNQTERSLLLDVGRQVFGMALHPRFAENGYVFVTSVMPGDPSPTGVRVSRYQAQRLEGQPPFAEASTETVILEWPSGGHMGGCLEFGPDGMLYASVGDGSGIADGLQTGQDVSDLLASLVRIDVDRAEAGRNYAIPADNPFVGRPGARPELWAYGLRQVWRFGFDRQSGRLYAGEVGQDLWEMIYVIEKGGNYGWSVREGAHPFRPERKPGPTPVLPPLVEHPHSDFRSITGGYVYRGTRLPKLQGAYVYADYDTGKIWSLRHEGSKIVEHRELDDTQYRIVSFGQTPDGEVYFLDFPGGGIHQLVEAPPESPAAPPFPRKLSETGLFADTTAHRVAPGVIPYSVNSELWSDGALKERFLAVPGEGQIEFDGVTYPQPPPGADPGWRFPHDTVLVKTFSLELEPGNPASRRRLETRILHHKKMPGTEEYGDQFWRGYTYVWNDEQTDAELLDDAGLDRTYTVRDPQAPGGRREQVWHFPSRAECTLCHTMAAKYALGVNTLQMNRDHDYNGVIANQLATLSHIGLFTKPLPQPPESLPSIVDYHDESQPLALRARSYLHSNCAHCHRKWGGGNADFVTLALLPANEMGLFDVRPGQGQFGLRDPRLVVPGDPARSLVPFRMQTTQLGRMPHVGSKVVDDLGVTLVKKWIESLEAPGERSRTGLAPRDDQPRPDSAQKTE